MNNLKSIIRIMLSDKKNHLLNLTGLSIGLCVVILISLYIRTELVFDNHIDNHTNKYRLLQKFSNNRESIFPYIASEAIRNNVPELKSLCLIDNEDGQLSVSNNKFDLKHVLVSDSFFIEMFSVQIINGSKINLLNEPNTCIISESTSRKLFGESSPIGETINFYSGYNGTVAAVFKDFPHTSHLQANIIISRSSWNSLAWKKRYFTNWGMQGTNLYAALDPESEVKQIQSKVRDAIIANAPWFEGNTESAKNYEVDLQPMVKVHLYSSDVQWDNNIIKNDVSTIKAFAIIMLLVLLLACFNYVNLSTANSKTKNRLAGIQKSLGAKRKHVFRFFLTQTLIIGVFAIILALFLSYLLLSSFNDLINSNIQISMLFDPVLWKVLALTIISVILFSGLYPAFYLSSGSPIEVIKNSVKTRVPSHTISLRSVLVTLQFIISIFLVISLLSIRKQIVLLTNEKLGFDKEQLIEIQHYSDKNSFDFFAGEFKKLAFVKDVTTASNMPCEYINNENNLTLVGEENINKPSACLVGVKPNYFQLMNTHIIAGRGFDENLKTDESNVLINQTTVKTLGLAAPIGVRLKLMGNEYTVIGVVEDVQYRTLREPTLPVLYSSNYSNYRKIAIKLHPGNHIEAIDQIKAIWDKKRPNSIINLRFFDNKLNNNYSKEVNHLHLFNSLVLVGFFIMILGLIGLIWFITEQKTKEIGVRKVNGAKVTEIIALLNADFIKWVFTAFIIATPVAYYVMTKWLENFAYKTEMSWWIFALAGAIALSIALLTVSWQSWRAASRNPVEALRYE